MNKQVFVLCTGHSARSFVTVCDAAAENCPIWQDDCLHITFPDMARVDGYDSASQVVYRTASDDIERHILSALDG